MPMRAIQTPETELMASPVATNIILGTPHPIALPGLRILPRKPVEWKFRWYEWDKAHLKRRDTERPFGAPFKHDEFHSTFHDDSLKRYSWSSVRDVDEFKIADAPLDLQVKHGVYARMIVDANLERLRRDVILNAAYPSDQIITLAPGDEFDSATGGAKGPIVELMNLICRRTGWSRNDLEIFMPFDTFEAALADPLFQAERRATVNSAKNPTADELRAYYGSGPVWTANTLDATDADVVDQTWPDVTIIYGPGQIPEYDTEWGLPVFGRTFGWLKDGVANVPVPMGYPYSATAYPWTDYQKALILTAGAGGKIINCSSKV